MSAPLVVMSLVGAAAVPYVALSTLERVRRRRAAAIHEVTAALAEEAYPTTLHPDVDLDACIGSGACIRACPEHDVLAITDGRVRLVNPLACVAHSACVTACPVDAIKLVYGTATRGVELPKLSETFETNQPGVYIVGELGGMGLIRNSIEQGRQAAMAIASGGGAGDTIVVGAGPAGIGAALGLIAQGRRVVVVDQDRFGGAIAHYPRGKVVMTGELVLPGYGTVRKKTMSKEQLLELWDDIRARTGLVVEEGVRIEALERAGGAWRVRGANGWERTAATVVLALGKRGAPNQLGVPGEAMSKVSYRVIEPEQFAGKRVLVVGGGNAAADCAIALAEYGGCESVALSYRRTELARLRGPVRAKIDALFASGALVARLGTEVIAIRERDVVLRASGNRKLRMMNDAVVVQIGGRPPSALLATIGIALVEKRGTA